MSSPSDAACPRCPLFIAFEGVDGSGKTTQANLLAEWLRAQSVPVVLTREPGGTVLGERLRAIVLDPIIACSARAELLVMLAARAQHVSEVILPALQSGHVVISDRFSLSSLAYQGFGRGLPLEEIRACNSAATGGIAPDATFLIDVSYEAAIARIGERNDRFEGEGARLMCRVIEGYRQLSKEEPSIFRIDGTGQIEAIQEEIRQKMCRVPANRSSSGGNNR